MQASLDTPLFRVGGGSDHIPKVVVLIFPKSFFLKYFFPMPLNTPRMSNASWHGKPCDR